MSQEQAPLSIEHRHSERSTTDKPTNHHNPWHAIGRFAKNTTSGVGHHLKHAGHGLQDHVQVWKKHRVKKQLESHLQTRARLEVDTTAGTDSCGMSRTQSLQSLGEIGMTLFSPLDGPFEVVTVDGKDEADVHFEPESNDCGADMQLTAKEPEATDSDESDSVTAEESGDDDLDVLVLEETTEEKVPLLLTMNVMRQLREAMPLSAQLKIWTRLYSVARDGDAFQTFLNCVAGHRQTLLVIQTASGQVFGGYADAHWGKLAMRTDGSYYGSGRSFLFAVESAKEDLSTSPTTVALADYLESGKVVIHPWQGVNEYSILCNTQDGGRLAMGGGGADGSFGFCVEDHFTKGSSGPCATFGNEAPLSGSAHFDVVNFEVYGFVNRW